MKENEIDSTNRMLEQTELALDSKSTELTLTMAQVEVLESTNETLLLNMDDLKSKNEKIKDDLESEIEKVKLKDSEILEMSLVIKKLKSDFQKNELEKGDIEFFRF